MFFDKGFSKTTNGILYTGKGAILVLSEEMNFVNSNAELGLLPIELVDGKISYKTSTIATLKQYLTSEIVFNDALHAFTQIAEIIKLIEENDFDTSKLYLNNEYVLFDKSEKKVLFVYQPTTPFEKSVDVKAFISSLLDAMALKYPFMKQAVHSFKEKLEKCDAKGESLIQLIESAKKSPKAVIEKKSAPSNKEEYDDITVFSDEDYEETISEDEDEETHYVDEEEVVLFKAIFEAEDGKRYEILGDNVSLGKDAKVADCVISSEKTVSRKHAFLYRKEDSYYLVDNSSTNGTFVNDVRLEPNENAFLKDGDVVKLAKESFVFHVEEC